MWPGRGGPEGPPRHWFNRRGVDMPTCKIDGKVCEFEDGDSILKVAWTNGIPIPHYCYHPGLTVVASCRICLVEVWAPNPRKDGKLEAIPKLLPSCQSPAQDGTEVFTNSPKAVANQRAVMEYLLINHPVDCAVCDQAGECLLQDYSYEYGRGQSRFEEEKNKQPKKDVGDNILLYSDRCIMCSRCVRFTREISETGELYVNDRGSTEQIDIFPGMPLNNPIASNVIDLCPVGALLDKDFLFQQRVWFLKQTPSIDGITASGDNIFIEHNEGRIYRIKPRTNEAINKWWISDEVRYGYKFVHADERLRYPMRQQYNNQTHVDYAHAYEQVDTQLTQISRDGGKLALLVSPMITCEEAHLLASFVKGYDREPIIGIGPIPIEGEDQRFAVGKRGEFLICAEKCPNRRGVQRVLEKHTDAVLDFEAFIEAVKDKKNKIGATVITGNYPSEWATKEFISAVGKTFTVLLDTMESTFSAKADIVLPAATWAEKSGTFENHGGVLQAFEQAIPVIEYAKSEGQLLEDLINLAEGHHAEHPGRPRLYNPARVRQAMADELGLTEFVTDVQMPFIPAEREPDMEVVEL
jgi:NADH-quinone oxidoreductase subunit G